MCRTSSGFSPIRQLADTGALVRSRGIDHLRAQDTWTLLTGVHELAAIDDLAAFPTQAMSVLRTVVPSLHSSYNEVNPRQRRMLYVFDTPGDDFPGSEQVWLDHMHEHPLVTHYHQTRGGHARKISDFLSQQQLMNLGLYADLYRRLHTRYQMSITLPSPAFLTVAFVLNRDRHDFTERDRLVLNMLRPHLIQAYRNAEILSQFQQENTLLRQAIEESNRGVIIVKNTGRIRSMTEPARCWVEAYCGHQPHTGEWLPMEIRQWFLQQQAQRADNTTLPQPHTPLVLEREGKRLRIRLLTNDNEGQHLLLLEEQTTHLTPASLAVLGLSQREAEVLYWLIQGKTNPEIGTILSLSPRTVQTHLERIYQKLGVETRAAATMQALESLGFMKR